LGSVLIPLEDQDQAILLEAWLKTAIAPQANTLDTDRHALVEAMSGLAKLGILGLRIPAAWGGLEASPTTFCLVQELIARYSGALAFLQVQSQSAIALLLKSENEELKQTYLTRLSQGKEYWGVGFSHLRRPGPALLQAAPVSGGYELTGQIPWVTGAGCFGSAIAAAVLPEGQSVFGRIPLANCQHTLGGTIEISQPIDLATMTSTQTVSATLNRWLLTEADVVDFKPADWIDQNDRQNLLGLTWLALGCARAGLDVAHAQHRPLDLIAKPLADLSQEVEDCRQQIWRSQQQTAAGSDLFEQRLDLRAWSVDLAVRCAHAAIAIAGGAANDQQHPAQRIYREALMFTVSGQTPQIMAAILNQLTR
jgi:alkylation response protein AidB-like acyl-CoA dehydrogenase